MNKTWKYILLCLVISLCLLMTGCYIAPDDINDSKLPTGNGNLPFDTLAPTATVTPTPNTVTVSQNVFGVVTSAPAPTNPSDTPIPSNDWTWDMPTNTPGTGLNTKIILSTPTPGPGNTIAVTSSTPTIKISTPTPKATVKVTGKPTATPTPASLQKGFNGDKVRTLQKRLKELGYYTGSIDGDFGTATEDAVKAFQKANGLSADGKVGKNTQEKLNSSSAIRKSSATKKPTSAPTKKITPTPRPTATPNLTKDYYLRDGSEGNKVKTLQERLISLGWMGGKATGDYGGATEYAVKAYQKKTKGLYDDGVAGPDTLASIYSSGATRSSSVVSSIGVTLENGSEGASVRALQSRLKSLGYLSGSVDGSFGISTQAAVIAFQTNNGLTADGKAGTGTLNKIYSDSAVKSNGTSINTGSGNGASVPKDISSTGYVTLELGSTGAAVRKLQETLKKYGYYTGSVDGTFGPGTEASVMAFQQKSKLTADGKAGPATQRKLYSSDSSISYATLEKGSSGSSVRNLQYTLYELGYYDGNLDGEYGDTTADAVRAFQINNDLKPVDGKAGSQTLQKLYSSSAKSVKETKVDYGSLRPGDKGNKIMELQDCLVEAGYNITVDGVYGQTTEDAVRDYQKKHGLNADGIAGEKTLQMLFGY